MRQLASSVAILLAALALSTADASAATPQRAQIIAASSPFGKMLYDSRRQAIYGFSRDTRNRSNCKGTCAKLWPPVRTRDFPRAGTGVRRTLLGTIRRGDGTRQVTYAGKPLYFYANERPRQVRCHNVFLNGGLWWVIGPSGAKRR